MPTTRSKSATISSGMSVDKDNPNTGNAAVFAPINHPILSSMDPSDMIIFMQKRTAYELQISEKKREIPSLTAASYVVSIEPQLLKSMHFMGEFDEVAPNVALEQLTSEQIKSYISKIVSIDNSKEPDSQVIEKALIGLKTPMHIADHKARIKQLIADYLQRMESIGYSNFKNTNKKMTIKHIKQIQKDIEYKTDLKTDIKLLIEHVSKIAEHVDKAQEFTKKPNPKQTETPKPSKPGQPTSTQPPPSRTKPLCLLPEHKAKGIRCYMSQCSGCTKEEGAKLVEQFKKEQKDKKTTPGAKSFMDKDGPSNNDFNVDTVFADVYNGSICVDSGSDVNLMDNNLLNKLKAQGAVMHIENLTKPQVFGLAVSNDSQNTEYSVTCKRTVGMAIKMKIRHANGLVLRNLLWYVTEGNVNIPLLGNQVLKALGLTPPEMLKSAFEKFGGDIDIDELVEQDLSKGSIGYLMNQGVFHSQNEVLPDQEVLDSECFVDLGEDSDEELMKCLDILIDNARKAGMKEEAHQKLKLLVYEYKDIS